MHLWKHYHKYIITLEKRVCFLLSFDSVRTTTHHHVFLKKVQVRRLVIISRPPILIQCDDHMRICQFSGTHCTAAGWRTTYARRCATMRCSAAAAAFSALLCCSYTPRFTMMYVPGNLSGFSVMSSNKLKAINVNNPLGHLLS